MLPPATLTKEFRRRLLRVPVQHRTQVLHSKQVDWQDYGDLGNCDDLVSIPFLPGHSSTTVIYILLRTLD